MTMSTQVGDRSGTTDGGTTARTTNRALSDAAARLVEERPDQAPGSVLRCFSKAVRAALLAGVPTVHVAAEAERLARWQLSRRPSGPSRVPRPRRAS